MAHFATPGIIIWLSLLTIFVNGDSIESRVQRRAGTMSADALVCLTEDQCRRKFQKLDLRFLYVGDWPTKGCFYKGNNAYFGSGGTIEAMSISDLPGIQGRIWCDAETEEPTANPSRRPTAIPTSMPVTDSPTKNPTAKPVTDSPTKQPSSKPVIYIPTKQPTEEPDTQISTNQPTPRPVTDSPVDPASDPVTFSPTKQPTAVLVSATINSGLRPMKQPATKLAPDNPTKQPSSIPVTDSPSKASKQPTSKPVTYSPTNQPSPKPVTNSPTTQPTVKPVTDSPSKQPTRKPVTNSPSTQPTSNPVTHIPTYSPTELLITNSPTTHPTFNPVTESPTAMPTANPVMESTSTQPTVNPVTDNSIAEPMANPVIENPPEQPSRQPTLGPSVSLVLSGGENLRVVPMSPFTMSLQTSPQTDSVDSDELTYLVSIHLLGQMQATLTSSEVTRLDVDVSPIPSQRRLEDGLAFASDNYLSKEHEFTVNGTAYLAGPVVLTMEELDVMTQKAFEGESGDEFVHSLQQAEDAGLQSTRSFSVSEPDSSELDGVPDANYLPAPGAKNPVVTDKMYMIGIVFVVGFALVALYVFKTRRVKKIQRESEENIDGGDDEESGVIPELPRYISIENIGNEEGDGESEYCDKSSHYASVKAFNESELPEDSLVGSFPSNTNDDNLNTLPQTQSSSEHQAANRGVSGITEPPQEVEEIQEVQPKTHITSNLEPPSYDKANGGDPNRGIKNTALSESLSVFPSSLPSISESNDKNQGEIDEWNPCGGYPTLDEDANDQSDSSSIETQSKFPEYTYERPSEDEIIECCYGVGDVGSDASEKRVTSGYWGEQPEDFSYQSQSQTTMDDTRTTSTWGTGAWGQMAADLVSEGSQSSKTDKMDNVSSP